MLESPRTFSRGKAWLLAFFVVGACEDDSGQMDAGDDSEPITCVDDERAEAFTVDMSKMGTGNSVTIVDAMPAEPDRGDNTWTVRIADAGGTPEESMVVTLRPWMPDHGHGSPVEPEVTDLGGGEYEVQSLNLFMPGLWQITFDLETADGTTDEVMFSICIE